MFYPITCQVGAPNPRRDTGQIQAIKKDAN